MVRIAISLLVTSHVSIYSKTTLHLRRDTNIKSVSNLILHPFTFSLLKLSWCYKVWGCVEFPSFSKWRFTFSALASFRHARKNVLIISQNRNFLMYDTLLFRRYTTDSDSDEGCFHYLGNGELIYDAFIYYKRTTKTLSHCSENTTVAR